MSDRLLLPPIGASHDSAPFQSWYTLIARWINQILTGHIGVGGTAQHPIFTTTAAGFAPASVAVAGKFLRDDGTWQVAGGGGGSLDDIIMINTLL